MTYTLSLYVVRQIGFWFVVTWFSVALIWLCGDLVELLRRAPRDVPFFSLLGMASLRTVVNTDILLPFVAFIAVRVALWRLRERIEWLACCALGFSHFFWMRLLLVLAVLVSMFHLFILQPTGSLCQASFNELEVELLKQKSSHRFTLSTSGLWLNESHRDGQRVIHAMRADDDILHDMTLHEFDRDQHFVRLIKGDSGILRNNAWCIQNARVIEASGSQFIRPEYRAYTTLTWQHVKNTQVDPRGLSFWHIQDVMPILDRLGLSKHPYLVSWHHHIAQCGLITALLMMALAILPYSLVWMFLAFFVYVAHDVLQALAQAGQLPILLSSWSVPLVIMALSIAWIIHIDDRPYVIGNKRRS